MCYSLLNYFFPNPEFIAFATLFIPHLARFPIKLPVCLFFCLWFLWLFTILLAFFVSLMEQTLLYFLTFLGPIVLVHLIVTFKARFFLLTLSYLASNDVRFGN